MAQTMTGSSVRLGDADRGCCGGNCFARGPMPPDAMRSDGAGHPGAESKSRSRLRLAGTRLTVGSACPFPVNRECGLCVAHVISDQSVQMLFVQRDDMVQDLAPATSNPSFRNSILPGRLHARPFQLQPSRLRERDHGGVEDQIAIQDGVPIRASFWEGLAQLLDNPLRCRVAGHIEVQNSAPSMLRSRKSSRAVEMSPSAP